MSKSPSPSESSSRPKPPSRFIFKATYSILAFVTAAAIATPPATAANILPDSNIGALTIVSAVAILMTTLVFEIWRQTGKENNSNLQNETIQSRKNRKNL